MMIDQRKNESAGSRCYSYRRTALHALCYGCLVPHCCSVCCGACRLVNTVDTWVSQALAVYGEWCEHEVDVYRAILRAGDCAVDVGANVGAFTVPLGRAVGRSGAVYAFEAQRHLHHLVAANAALNELYWAWVFHAAVGAERGSVQVPRANYDRPANFGGISLLDPYWPVAPRELLPRNA